MRTLMIAGAVIALAAADGASAQVTVHRGNPGAGLHPAGHQTHGGRWGSKIGGRWWGGSNAPGGWQAYRRPVRGYALPRYWVAPRFYITDWSEYGLDRPRPGYNWARYYDDAVMIDSNGSVYDTVDGVDWDGDDAGPDGYDRDDGPPSPPHGRGYGADYPPPGPGFEGDRPPPPPHGRGPDYPPPPPPPGGPHGYHHGDGDRWVSPDGLTTVTTSGGYGGAHYYTGGYGGSTTTVTVETAPVVTTTTETTYQDVSYSRPHKVWRKKWHAKVWRAKPRCACK